ncbi:MAG: hypothetical protein JXQ73_00005, partial [Phycisphaerae bacterium]|nr:hypothetical protein [Phycisphaerae bacterium]
MPNRAIDFCIGWGPWPDEPFLDIVRKHCALRNLSCVVCKDAAVYRMISAVESGRTSVGLYLDLQADYEDDSDAYHRLAYATKDQGAFVVNEPDNAKLGLDKARLHYRFEREGIPVPPTVVVRNWEPSDFRLTPTERKRLGRPFIIKPARGYGKQGIAKANAGTVKEIARARRYDRGDDFLLQALVAPEWFGHRMGWFRVFNVLGQVILCWWDTTTEHYACVTTDEYEAYGLATLCRVSWRIARTTHMNFFSTELAAVRKGRRRRFLAIDYVNDPCDLTPQS